MDQQSVKKIITVVLMELCLSWQAHAQQTITKVNPPVFGFYGKQLDCDGIMIRSSAQVDDKALLIAAQKINLILANIPNARRNLARWGAELHIIGKDQQTSDLPEFRDQKGVKFQDNGTNTDIDARTRGMGGIYTSCGEENLLNLPGDRYAGGSDICIHEFAHNIMFFGLGDTLQNKIKQQYQNAIRKGLWTDAYAARNAGEYWAELSMWYFGAHGEFLNGTRLPAPGAQGLMKYDPEGYALLNAIYSGKLPIAVANITPAKRLTAKAASGNGREKAVLMIANNTSHKVKLFWIDFLGKAHSYGELSAYNRGIQITFVSHVWQIEDDKGKVLAYFSPTTPNAVAIIN